MEGNVVGTAVLAVIPSLKGGTKAIEKELQGGGLQSAGSAGGKEYTKGFKKNIGGLKKIMGPAVAAAAGVGIAAGLKTVISAASDLEQSLGGVDAIFGKSAKAINKASASAASDLGLSKNAYNELATTLGAGLKNKGIKDFAGETQNLIGLGADLAAQFGGSSQQAIEAISSAMRGESDPIEKYGVSLNETAVKAELAAKGQDNLTGAALEQAKAQARISILMKQTTDAQGTFADESDTAAGKQARLTASMENIKTTIGTGLLPVFSSVTGVVEKFVTGMDQGTGAGGKFADFLGKLKSGFSAVYDLVVKGDFTGAFRKTFGVEEDAPIVGTILNLRDNMISLWDYVQNNAIPAARSFMGWLAKNKEVLIAMASGILAGVVAFKAFMFIKKVIAMVKAARLAVIAFNAALRANPIGIVITAIMILVGVLVYLYRNNETVRRVIDAAWAKIKSAISGVVTWFKDVAWPALKRAFNALKEFISKVPGWFASVRDRIKSAWAALKSMIMTPIRAAVDWARDKIGGLISKFRSVRNAIGNAWASLSDKIKAPFRSAINWINTNFISKINGFLDKIGVSWRVPLINVVSGSTSMSRSTRGGAFATGGYTGAGSKYQPAGIVHADEFVLRKEATNRLRRTIGLGGLNYMNATGQMPSLGGYASGGLVALGRELQRMGYHVSEHPAFGGVVPGAHSPTGWHYKAGALDINADSWNSPFSNEMKALDSLNAMLRGDGWNTIWRAPNHWDHLHVDIGNGQKGGGGLLSKLATGTFDKMVGNPAKALLSGMPGSGLLKEAVPALGRKFLEGIKKKVMGMISLFGEEYATGGLVKPLLFDSGGYLPEGLSLVQNNTGKPEPLKRMDTAETGNINVYVQSPWTGEYMNSKIRDVVSEEDNYDSTIRRMNG